MQTIVLENEPVDIWMNENRNLPTDGDGMVPVSTRLDPEIAERLELLRRLAGLDRSAFLRLCITESLEAVGKREIARHKRAEEEYYKSIGHAPSRPSTPTLKKAHQKN